MKDIQEQSADPADFEDVLQSCDIAALCNINFNRRLIQAAHRRGVTTATDVHVLGEIDDDYNRDFMANADILFLSDEKLPCSAEECVRRLHDRYHNKIIAVGMGAQGALLFDAARGETVTVPAYHSGSVVNTIGAGDALFSAFLHFYAKGMDGRLLFGGGNRKAPAIKNPKGCRKRAAAPFWLYQGTVTPVPS